MYNLQLTIEKGKEAIQVVLYYSVTFDTISHDSFLHGLARMISLKLY